MLHWHQTYYLCTGHTTTAAAATQEPSNTAGAARKQQHRNQKHHQTATYPANMSSSDRTVCLTTGHATPNISTVAHLSRIVHDKYNIKWPSNMLTAARAHDTTTATATQQQHISQQHNRSSNIRSNTAARNTKHNAHNSRVARTTRQTSHLQEQQ
mgnify:CR=1 FL=1